ncbi:MAG: DUF1659 domain-containing protein [Eubacterium sp.]
MAVVSEVKGIGLKIISNYGESSGKIVKKTRTYSDVKPDATNDKVFNTFKWIKGLQEPVGESCTKIVSEELIEGV